MELRAVLAGVMYAGPQDLEQVLQDRRNKVLGCIAYGAPGELRWPADAPFAWTGMDTLGSGRRFEVWLSSAPVAWAAGDGMRIAYSDEVLFACLEFQVAQGDDFQARAWEHYCRVFDVLDERGYPHLLRAWHYLPDIHRDEAGLERYRRFSVARHEAFVAKGRTISDAAPAASAVGTSARHAVLFFLAGRSAGTPIANPRQVNAYEYPPQYGPRGPTFARALHASWDGVEQLYVSGTASIVGYESRHPDDVTGQARETVQNLHSVFSQAHARGLPAPGGWQDLLFKIYLRDPGALEEVTECVRRAFGDRVELLCLRGDICRRELLLEIEAVASQPRRQAA